MMILMGVFSQRSLDNNVNERWVRGQGSVSLFLKKNLKARVLEHVSNRIITAHFKFENTEVFISFHFHFISFGV